MRLLGVDIDDCFVNPNWKAWLDEKKGSYSTLLDSNGRPVEKLPFALGEFYKPWIDFDPYDFWRSETLYDNLEPIEGAVEALEKLSAYFGIVFVSRLKGFHHGSKVRLVKKHCPFMQGFVGTHEKWILNDSLVAMIDDQQYNLKGFDSHKRIWFNGQYTQKETCEVSLSFGVWNDEIVQQICENYL